MSLSDVTNGPLTAEDWKRWSFIMPPVDLLPAVWDMSAPRATTGHIASLRPEENTCKKPSFVQDNNEAVMIKGWSKKITTKEELEFWQRDPRHNILMITRTIRAIDIDITDPVLADEVEQAIAGLIGQWLPTRYRNNSSKRTLFVRIDPLRTMLKRKILTKVAESKEENTQAIEFLGTHNQTLLAGVHDSGAVMQHRYFESGQIPTVTLKKMEEVWDWLRYRFWDVPNIKKKPAPLIDPDEDRGLHIQRVLNVAGQDPVVDYLNDKGLVLGVGGSGQIFVDCPWKSGHSSDSGVSEAAYFPHGLAGRTRGFHCFHTHCSDRHSNEFLSEIGYLSYLAEQDFIATAVAREVAAAEEAAKPPVKVAVTIQDIYTTPLPQFSGQNALRKEKGKNLPTGANAALVVREDKNIVDARYDAFEDQCYVRIGGADFRKLTDVVVGELGEICEHRYNVEFPKEKLSLAIERHAKGNSYDSAHQWVAAQQWDSTPRIDAFAKDILKATDDAYGVALARFLWASMVARVLAPGCKVDMAAILISPKQGTGKSSLVRNLVPVTDWFAEVDLSNKDEDLVRSMRGKLVLEISEMRGLSARDSDSTKAFVTRQTDEWIPKYREYATAYPRRSVFVGTTNHTRVLIDPSGNRRWLPIRVAMTARFVNWPELRVHCGQYWAEAVKMIEQFDDVQSAVEHYAQAVDKLAEPARLAALRIDDQMDEAKRFLAEQLPGQKIATRALMAALNMRGNHDSYRVHAILRMLGYQEIDGTNDWRPRLTQEFVL